MRVETYATDCVGDGEACVVSDEDGLGEGQYAIYSQGVLTL